ncbi:MAG TPA: cbb3-type cytochrome c oxidase subunit I, partial [Opitutales bacterium]|nr:cbb3-type cytochrome c oxidase subunit I [Opitutales bacterium]
VFSGAAIGFMGFTVWSHHMFTTGLGKVATIAFSLLTMAIAVPTGVKILNWVGTLWGGRIRFSVPMVFALGFIWMFMMGGLSGIMHSAAPGDAQQQDSYFVVAHFHYVLLGGILLGLLGGIYFWTPKITGKMMHQKLGYIVAAMVIVGFNVAFFPMHYLGLAGMPRRTHTYQAGFGWEGANMLATIGAIVLGLGIFMCFMDLLWTVCKSKRTAPQDPWDARTLEWATHTPVPEYNFARTPIIAARDAWWAHKYYPEPEYRLEYEPANAHGIHMPSQSWFPLMGGLGFLLAGVCMCLHGAGVSMTGYGVVAGITIVLLSIFLWALEGPGGYHLQVPGAENDEVSPQASTHKPSNYTHEGASV